MSHAAQPGWRQAGQALPQGSLPLLVPFSCSLHSAGSWTSRGIRKRRGTHPHKGQNCAVQGSARLAERSLEQREQQECASPSRRTASPLEMGHILSHSPGPAGIPDLLCPTEEPAQVCCGSSKQTDFNAHSTQHHHGRDSSPPSQPFQAISGEAQPPLALQLPAGKLAWAASPLAMPLASAASPAR